MAYFFSENNGEYNFLLSTILDFLFFIVVIYINQQLKPYFSAARLFLWDL